MKKWLSWALALCLLLTSWPLALAEEPTGALPQVGDVVYGFEAKEVRDFPLVGAQVVLFEHQNTGAQLYYIANDDINRVFDLTFRTDAIDNTGLPHVFEHSTLSGSEKYPSAALFFNLSFQTYNTFMNAMTYDRMTTYPIASLSEAQLLKYADFYTDSCLHPMILKDESIYRTEAWRYRLTEPEGELTLEGTVYSEMLGAFDLASQAYYNAVNTVLPGSMLDNESGGHPDYIPEMTYESLVAFHEKYYHPSNSIAFLYGQFEDYTAFLRQLDEAYAGYERVEFTRSDDGYTPLQESLAPAFFQSPAEAGSPTDGESIYYYAFVCRDLPVEQWNTMDMLLSLLTDSASDLMQSFQAAYPGASLSAYVEPAGPEPVVFFVAENINPEDAEGVKGLIDGAIAKTAEGGFPQDLIDAAVASLALQTRLLREGDDVGVNLISSIAYNAVVTGDPWAYMKNTEAFDMVEQMNNDGVFSQLSADYLNSDAAITAQITTSPAPGLKEEKDAQLAAKLAEIKAGMSEEEIAALVEASNTEPADADASEYVAALQAVTVDSLPEEIREYEVTDETDESGVRHVDVVAGVDGVGNANVFLDASGLTQDQILWFKLFVSLLGDMDTTSHTKAELATLQARYLYEGDIRVSLLGGEDDARPYLRMTWIAGDEDLAAGYDLMREMVFDTQFTNVDMLKASVNDLRTSAKNNMTGTPYMLGLYRMSARHNAVMAYSNHTNMLDWYEFLGNVATALDSDPDVVTSCLNEIQSYFNNSTNAMALFAGNEESIALNRTLSDQFLAALGTAPIEKQTYDFGGVADKEGVVMDIAVAFNGVVASLEDLGLEEYTGDLDAVSSLVNDVFLIPQLRDQYGVYSVFHGFDDTFGGYIITYRDPNVTQTFDMIESLPEQLGAFEVDQETLDGYILSAYARYAMPEGELKGAVNAGLDVLAPENAMDKIATMRQLKAITPETFGEYVALYTDLVEKGGRFTIASASMVNGNAALYDAVMNPFGAVDTTQVAFDDLPEDHPQYEAVRYVFENNYMVPAGETTFGVDEPATLGDLAILIYVIAGGDTNLEDAAAFAVQYGLVDGSADTDDHLTDTEAVEKLSMLATLFGLEWTVETTGEEMTRGDLAEMIIQFENDLT